MKKISSVKSKGKVTRITTVLLLTILLVNVFSVVAYAGAPGWGKNAFDFIQETVSWIVLATIVVFAVRFIVRRAWVQFGGFLLIGAFVLYIVDTPQSLKSLGSIVWNFIFK